MIYFDRSGFGSMKSPYQDAKAKDTTITVDDVNKFVDEHVEQKKQQRRYTSFIAPKLKCDYQVDFLVTIYRIRNIK